MRPCRASTSRLAGKCVAPTSSRITSASDRHSSWKVLLARPPRRDRHGPRPSGGTVATTRAPGDAQLDRSGAHSTSGAVHEQRLPRAQARSTERGVVGRDERLRNRGRLLLGELRASARRSVHARARGRRALHRPPARTRGRPAARTRRAVRSCRPCRRPRAPARSPDYRAVRGSCCPRCARSAGFSPANSTGPPRPRARLGIRPLLQGHDFVSPAPVKTTALMP